MVPSLANKSRVTSGGSAVPSTHLTQQDCNRMATKLNRRPRKRLDYRTPEECYVP